MSDEERADDLFGDSDNEAPNAQPSRQPSPVASSSKSPAPPAQVQSPAEGGDAEEDGDLGGDLFGDDDEEEERAKRGRSSTGTPASRRSRSIARSRSRSGSANPLEYEEEDIVESKNEAWVALPLPQWNKMQATDDKIWHMKLPAYVNIDSNPYEPDLYRETLNEESIDGAANPIAAKSKMIGVRNTIRWKWVTGGDGEPTRQSNARMLRWSDGSVSLQLGADLFDVAPSHGATLARPQDPKPPLPAGTTKQPEQIPNTVSATTFLSVTAPQETVLVTERAIAGQLSLLPTSMDSKTHLELVKHVGQQHVKHSRMKMLEETAKDEESLQKLLLKGAYNRESINIKAAADKPKRAGGRSGSGSKGSGLGRTSSGGSFRKSRMGKKSFYSDSEGSDDDDDGPRRNVDRVFGGAGVGGDYDEDDGFVVADSDEDEYGSTKKKSKSKSKSRDKKRKNKSYTDDEDEEEEEEDLDEMEEAERRIQARERERKRAKTSKSGSISKKKSRDYVDTDEDEDEEETAGATAVAGAEEEDAEGEEEEMEMDIESEED
ncbi:uncharacterized protein I303_100852 [Kwoniella dejecticola CBS 10117]|uniref:RNA polymerase-associated protein LEO1 n=1 Tax=Kwoniella dejecticola CBS 10117 TaxID=1296121 RepID=A0A1A6AG67_9TREE|nr:RNA polymerase-associated protein LEO1 [Kwoniella dejecticola CBS 10117]OBR89033.1 RNA polymerase-associated protein LEO1 [Kwoniella dejecticola CBS 10117]